MQVFQLYPERAWVSGEQIISWASDLRADTVATDLWEREGEAFDGDADAWDALVDKTIAALPPLDVDAALTLLSDSGEHTFSTRTRSVPGREA